MKVFRFFYEIAAELKLVKWPTYQELVNYTLVVFFVIFVSAVIVSLMDFGFALAMNFLLGWE